MKAINLFFLLLASSALQVSAQNSKQNRNALIGTWTETTDSLMEIKIISPTHVFFMVHDTRKDTFAFAGAGTYSTKGNKYIENLQYANFAFAPAFTFDYKVEKDKFHQKGVIKLNDGTQESINHVFTRVKSDKAYNGPHVGTWNQLSSKFDHDDGTKGSHTNATHIRYQIMTPTHWMRLSTENNKFQNAFGGTYTVNGNKILFKIEYASLPIVGATAELEQRFEGNKLTLSGIVKDANGKQINNIVDVFERVDTKATKSVAKIK